MKLRIVCVTFQCGHYDVKVNEFSRNKKIRQWIMQAKTLEFRSIEIKQVDSKRASRKKTHLSLEQKIFCEHHKHRKKNTTDHIVIIPIITNKSKSLLELTINLTILFCLFITIASLYTHRVASLPVLLYNHRLKWIIIIIVSTSSYSN